MNRFTRDFFEKYENPSIGIDFSTKTVTLGKSAVKVQVWDSFSYMGHFRHKHIIPMYYRGAAGLLVVFDVTNKDSFTNLQDWIKQSNQYADPATVKTLVGNKIDLVSERVVSQAEGEIFAQDHGMRYIETSALDASNVETAFMQTLEGKRSNEREI